MDFPIAALLDAARSEQWVQDYFHPTGLRCPGCGGRHEAVGGRFGRNRRSQTTVWRCRRCRRTYTVYSGTLFAGKQLRPAQVIALLRGVCKGESTAGLARELGLSRTTVHGLRRALQANAAQLQPDTPLPDAVVEADEMFQNAGEKRRPACGSARPAAAAREPAQGTRDVCQ
jgi:transposase-like protein